MKNILKSYFSNKRGMTLVEVLTAMAILSLLIFCFTPLFLTYFESIRIAGDEIKDVQLQSGVLQTVIGNFGAGKGGNYSANVSEIPIEFSTPSSSVSLSRENASGATVTTTLNQSIKIAIGNQLDQVKGDFLVSNPENVKDSYSTIVTQGTSSGLVCYPKTLTDDFVEAKIIVYGSGGIVFDQGSFANDFTLTCGLNGSISLSNGSDYTMKRLASSMVEITIYGGGDISFETSPLNIIYKGGQHVLQVEVDAPTMIMVGEADDDGKYYYYVSRGEMVDGNDGDTEKNELAIIRREMNSLDAKNSNATVELTSAMNDVEWVPADSGDGENVDSKGQKYGYYIMCGDNGQVRRFWRNNATGNYYWGGDYTYYTDYNLDRFSGKNPYIYTTDKNGNPSPYRVYSTDVSFKFIAMRPMKWEGGSTADGKSDADASAHKYRTGFNMSAWKNNGILNTASASLRNLCTVSATYGSDVQFYGSDGQVYMYIGYKKGWSGDADDGYNMPSFTTIKNLQGGGSYNGHDVIATEINYLSHEAWGWLDPTAGTTKSYFKAYGLTDGSGNPTVNTASYPITLTSVDAIRINGTGGVYESNVNDTGKSHYFTSGIIKDTDTSGDATGGTSTANTLTTQTNLTYPMSNYNLYCGYIPAYMDAWAGTTGLTGSYKYSTSYGDVYAKKYGDMDNIVSNIGRASNRPKLDDNATYYPLWRMTMGITPFYNQGTSAIVNETGQRASHGKDGITVISGLWHHNVVYYPYTNLEYAITGKFYDNNAYMNNPEVKQLFSKSQLTAANPNQYLVSPVNTMQNNTTNGEIVDITISYLSNPLALSISANPTDDVVYDLSNDKKNKSFYWHNRREAITFLDSASTVIPNGEQDVPVSLMVGYVLGGIVAYSSNSTGGNITADVTSVMNNGIVYLRSGSYNATKHDSSNAETGEYKATDNTGYQLAQESNVFHQFYYLNSRTILPGKILGITYDTSNTGYHGEYSETPAEGKSIGNLYGAEYWQNNRHIQYRSVTGGAASNGSDTATNYEYLRSHPMTNTKVNCVAWGTTWQNYPEAMWGTENGTVLSWWVNTTEAKSQGADGASYWNDRSVDAEFQSYKWVDNINGKTFANNGNASGFIDTIGSAKWGDKKADGIAFAIGSDRYKYFYDKTSQQTGLWGTIGFISTLETINDIEFSNDYWVAVGDQSDKDPADYCASGSYNGGGETAKAFSDNGRGGSWVNVRYWVDTNASGKQSDDNAYYHWRAVKISDKDNYNIVQINNVNGIWIATGYEDSNNNEEYDNGERTVVCWTRNPLAPCSDKAEGWSEKVQFYANNGANMITLDQNKVGGINSCATRTE